MAAQLTPKIIEMEEESFGKYTTTLKDEDGNAIASSAINSITMTLIETVTGNTVNSRSAQNVLNANNCTMHATSGLFTWNIQPDDTAIVGSTNTNELEEHLATITVVWNTTKKKHREILLRIKNMRKVPQS